MAKPSAAHSVDQVRYFCGIFQPSRRIGQITAQIVGLQIIDEIKPKANMIDPNKLSNVDDVIDKPVYCWFVLINKASISIHTNQPATIRNHFQLFVS